MYYYDFACLSVWRRRCRVFTSCYQDIKVRSVSHFKIGYYLDRKYSIRFDNLSMMITGLTFVDGQVTWLVHFDQRANIANSNIDNMYVMKKMTFYLCIYHANTHLWCSVHCTGVASSFNNLLLLRCTEWRLDAHTSGVFSYTHSWSYNYIWVSTACLIEVLLHALAPNFCFN